MAVIETWLEQDLQKPVRVKHLDGNFFSNNANGNRIGVAVYNNGAAVTLSGTVSGYVVLSDGTTVPCTGSRSGNKASVLVPPAAYQPGLVLVTVFLTDGNTVTTLAAVSANVQQARTDQQVSPGSVVTDWTNTINAAMQSVETAAANLGNIVATPYANLTFPVPLGKYTIYNNGLYRCISPIASSEAWTAAHWTNVKLGDDVADLKSAIEKNLSVDVIPLAGLEIGNINSNGDNRDSTTRLRTIKKYPVKAGSYIRVICGENQVYVIGKYVNNAYSASSWYSGDATIKIDIDCEVRFLIRYANETTITVAENKCTPQILSSFDYIAGKKLGTLQDEMKLVATSLKPQFELGTITNGVSSAATNKARTNTFIPVTDESIIAVKKPAKYGNFAIYYYKTASEDDYIAGSNDYDANTEYSIKSEYNGYIKIRFYYVPLVTLTEDDLITIGELFTVTRPDNVLVSVIRELNNVKAEVINTWVRRFHNTEIGSLSSGVPVDSAKYLRSSNFVQINKGDIVHLLPASIRYNAAVQFFYENNDGGYCHGSPVISVEPSSGATYISPITGYYKFRATYIPQRSITNADLELFNTLVYSESSPIYTEVINTINANPYVPKVTNVHSIAHRGFSTAPENTLIAFKQAKQHGFEYVETDVRFTSDNVPVLLHDETINRTARDENGNTLVETINIADITYADSQAYDFGSYKNSYYSGTKIPTFTEFMRLCRNIGLKPFIELKTGTQQQIANLYSIVKSFGMINDVCWNGEGTYLNYIKAIDNTATLCYISRNPSIDVIAGFKTGSNLVIAGIEDGAITNEFVQGCIQNDIPLLDWTINVDETIISSNPYITWYLTNGPMAEHVLYDNDMT